MDISECWEIFNSVSEGKEQADVVKKFKNRRNPTTIKTAYNVAKLLHCRGTGPLSRKEAQEIADEARYHANVTYVQTAFIHYKAWHEDRLANKVRREEHTRLIKEEAKRLRACVRNPRLHMLPDKRELLEVDNQDWRLDPVMWFYLCTPDFSNSKRRWGDSFSLLRQHTRGSSFWKDYGDLWKAARKLEEDYQIAAIQLGKDFDEYRELWNQISVEKLGRKRGSLFRPSKYPDAPLEEYEDFIPSYDTYYCDQVLSRFSKIIEGLVMQLLELEQKLEQLYSNLEPHKIYPIIDQGYCCECPQGGNQRGGIE